MAKLKAAKRNALKVIGSSGEIIRQEPKESRIVLYHAEYLVAAVTDPTPKFS